MTQSKPVRAPRLQHIFNILFFSVLLFLLYAYVADSRKIVYVDSARLLNSYEGMINARKAFQQKAAGWKANVDTLASEVKTSIMEYEKASAKMTAKERQLSQELIKTKQNQLGQYQQAMNTQAQQEDQKMTADVITQVNAYLKKYGEKNGYTVILAATEYGNIAYAEDALDVTDDVLEGLNNEYKGQ